MDLPIEISPDDLSAFCQQHQIRKLALFGSIVHGDYDADSDVAILVEFDNTTQMSLFDMGVIQVELSELFKRTVDLKTPVALSKYFRQDVINEAVTLYERT